MIKNYGSAATSVAKKFGTAAKTIVKKAAAQVKTQKESAKKALQKVQITYQTIVKEHQARAQKDSTVYQAVNPNQTSLRGVQAGLTHQCVKPIEIPENLNLNDQQWAQVCTSVTQIRQDSSPQTQERSTGFFDFFDRAIESDYSENEAKQVEVARDIRDVLDNQDVEVQEAILHNIQAELFELGVALPQMNSHANHQVIEELSLAGESIGLSQSSTGQENIHLLSDPFARGLPNWTDDEDPPYFQTHLVGESGTEGSVGRSVSQGQGSLFSSALTVSMWNEGDRLGAQALTENLQTNLQTLQENYQPARENYEKRQAQLLYAISENPAYSPEAVEAGITNFRQEHHEDYQNYVTQSSLMTATLQGSAYLLQHSKEFQELDSWLHVQHAERPVFGVDGQVMYQGEEDSVDELLEYAQNNLRELPALVHSDQVHKRMKTALLLESQGQNTFLSTAQALAQNDTDFAEEYNNATMYTVAKLSEESSTNMLDENSDASLREQAWYQMADILEGAGQVTPRHISEDEADSEQLQLHQVYLELANEVRETKIYNEDDISNPDNSDLSVISGEITLELLNDFENTLSRSNISPHLANGFRMVGVGLGAAGTLYNMKQLGEDFNYEDLVATGIDAASLAGNLPFRPAELIGKGAFYASMAFSAYNTVRSIQDGDAWGTVANAAPLVGATGCAIAGPLGSGTCAAIGAGVGAGIHIIRGILAGDPILDYEKDTQSFHHGAVEQMFPELSEEQLDDVSHRFRDTNLDGEGGWQQVIEPLAQCTNMSQEELLSRIVQLDDAQTHAFVKAGLRENPNIEQLTHEIENLENNGRFSDGFIIFNTAF